MNQIQLYTYVLAACLGAHGYAQTSRAVLWRPVVRTQEEPPQSEQKDLFSVSFSELLKSSPKKELDRVENLQHLEFPEDLQTPPVSGDLITREPLAEIPVRWWVSRVQQPILEKGHWITFGAGMIMLDGLTNSPRIQAVAAEPLVTEADIIEADAAFDPTLLLDGKIGRTSDPVGNELITGGAPRLREETLVYRMGVTRLNRNGGQFEAVQELGLLDNNSRFLVPRNQGNSKLSISLNQPLMAGAGRVFNERLVFQAKIDNGIAWQESLDEVQKRLADIYASYWKLYELRAAAIQRYDLLIRGQWVQERIEQRKILDANRSQVVRAGAAVTRRKAAMIQAVASIGDQQSRLIALVGSEKLQSFRESEFIPSQIPEFVPISGSLREAVVTAMQLHPRVRVAAHQLESACLALRVTRNQLLPYLNAVVDTYVAGLNGNHGAFDSFADQFSEGEPGLSLGLEYEFPIKNRAARARHQRQRYVLKQQQNELKEVALEVTAEIEIAFRAMEVAKAEIVARKHTLDAARTEESLFARRWEMIPGEDGSATFVLEDLLDAQERRTDAEVQWVSAKVNYLIAIARLQQAMGTLLVSEGIHAVRADGYDTSEIMFIQGQNK